MKPRENKPSSLWPIGTAVTYLDAYGLNPVNGKVIQHYAADTNVLVEDSRGVRHFGQTWRIDSSPPPKIDIHMFDDLLGDDDEPTYDFEDLL